MSLRDNLRKVFGVYEHELNGWIEEASKRVDNVLDVGANDGYFTFGCGAAFQRVGRNARITAFEPQAVHCEQLQATANLQTGASNGITFSLEQALVGKEVSNSQTTLDALVQRADHPMEPRRTLVKIDVEGAEIDVIDGASLWLDRSNYFLIEVHRFEYLDLLKKRFAAAGLRLEQLNQQPHPIFGREHRAKSNWWLVSPID